VGYLVLGKKREGVRRVFQYGRGVDEIGELASDLLFLVHFGVRPTLVFKYWIPSCRVNSTTTQTLDSGKGLRTKIRRSPRRNDLTLHARSSSASQGGRECELKFIFQTFLPKTDMGGIPQSSPEIAAPPLLSPYSRQMYRRLQQSCPHKLLVDYSGLRVQGLRGTIF
jgi:hypothetical protein